MRIYANFATFDILPTNLSRECLLLIREVDSIIHDILKSTSCTRLDNSSKQKIFWSMIEALGTIFAALVARAGVHAY